MTVAVPEYGVTDAVVVIVAVKPGHGFNTVDEPTTNVKLTGPNIPV